jgi:hypothetical protein
LEEIPVVKSSRFTVEHPSTVSTFDTHVQTQYFRIAFDFNDYHPDAKTVLAPTLFLISE